MEVENGVISNAEIVEDTLKQKSSSEEVEPKLPSTAKLAFISRIVTIESPTEEQLMDYAKDIRESFKVKKLYKGFSEVVNAIDDREALKKIVIVGALDPWYEAAFERICLQVGLPNSVIVQRIGDAKHRDLVYKNIKNIEVYGTKKYNIKKQYRLLNQNPQTQGTQKKILHVEGQGSIPLRLKQGISPRKFFLCRVFAIKE